MKLFVCWSGHRSYQLASFLKEWLETVVHGLDVFVSSEIEKGTPWSEAIREALAESRAGLVCLAWESRDSAWINYEAGALANAIGYRRVYPYLIGHLGNDDVPAPLRQFQSTRSTAQDTEQMVGSIADLQGDTGSWKPRFEREWPRLQAKLDELKNLPVDRALPGFFEPFDRRNTFQETFPHNLAICLDRYVVALTTHEGLNKNQRIVDANCRDDVRDTYNQLLMDLKEYASDIKLSIDGTARGDDVSIFLDDAEMRRLRILEFVNKIRALN